MELRQLVGEDYYRGYLSLMEQLTDVDKENITYDMFKSRVDGMNSIVYVIEDKGNIITSGTLIIEDKIIHGLSKVGHIEDIVVDYKYRGFGLGRKIIEKLVEISKEYGCYKTILNCSNDMVPFYQRLGFKQKNIEMSMYH